MDGNLLDIEFYPLTNSFVVVLFLIFFWALLYLYLNFRHREYFDFVFFLPSTGLMGHMCGPMEGVLG